MAEYGFGKRPLHPTDKYYHLMTGEPMGVPYPWHNPDNRFANDIYERNCGGDSHKTHYRRVNMCVGDIMRPDLRTLQTEFQSQVDEDFWRYRTEHAQKLALSLVYGFAIWLTVAGLLGIIRWIAEGEKAPAGKP